jgi:uncharacterized protein (TIGR00251 family)
VNGWCRRTPAGWLLSIHAQPGAKKNAVAGIHGESLRIRIAAPPVEGRANAALVAFLAEALGVPKKSVAVVKGGASRRKTVLISVPDAAPERLLRSAQASVS